MREASGELFSSTRKRARLAFPSKTVPTGNLLLSVLDKFDIHRETIGDSTGRLDNL